MDPQNTAEKKLPVCNDKQNNISRNKSSKVTLQDIQVVQNLIERCLQLYMNRDEVVNTLLDRASIEPGFTNLVWQKLEEENAEFFKAYHIRLKLKNQIDMYNQLLEQQYHLMKEQAPTNVAIAPVQYGMHHMPGAVNNLPMGYPIMHQSLIPSTGYPQINSMGTISSCHGVKGILASENFLHMQQNFAKENPADTVPIFPAGGVKLEVASSPISVASNSQFPFSPETSGLNLDTSALDSAYTSHMANLEGLSIGSDDWTAYSKESLQLSGQVTWDFGFSNASEWSNFQDFGAVENSGSEFQPSELDNILESPEQNDMVDEFLLDGPPGQGTQPEETHPK
ncbi:hypothetical protein M0R45_038213 [Rubus argutus]|uniref:Angiotensin-converting enzyme 2 n=1 Tax=Rubus argutus TaxID=59490 RepID=A0AAW1W2E1_RUBAR